MSSFSLKSQLLFSPLYKEDSELENRPSSSITLICNEFKVNKMRANLPKGEYVCVNCSHSILKHHEDILSEDDLSNYIFFISSKEGATCVLESSNTKATIIGSIYLGAYYSSVNPFVTKHNIGAIVNCSNLHLSNRSDFQSWAKKVEALEINGISVLRLNWDDSLQQNIFKSVEWDQLYESVHFIHQNTFLGGKNVLIHCAQGKSRSGVIMIAYLMSINIKRYYANEFISIFENNAVNAGDDDNIVRYLNLSESLLFVKKKRIIVDPNPNFLQQLQRFQSSDTLKILREEFK